MEPEDHAGKGAGVIGGDGADSGGPEETQRGVARAVAKGIGLGRGVTNQLHRSGGKFFFGHHHLQIEDAPA